MRLVMSTRENILVDLHTFYRSQGYVDSEITVKTANLLLLMPKIEVKKRKNIFNITILIFYFNKYRIYVYVFFFNYLYFTC